ncbi:MAG: signal peptidase II [Chloroflexi bacterium]|nr:signal peptidase II [Chloroflexota bacterium]
MPGRNDGLALVGIATFIAGFDQLTKFALISLIVPGQRSYRLDVVGDLVAVEYTENRGAAFGLFAGLAPLLALASIAVLVVLLLFYARERTPPRWHTIAVGLIAGGAIGNLFDRLRLGYVVDFVSVGPWPNFNVADAAITFGVAVWLWGWLRSETAWSATGIIDQES